MVLSELSRLTTGGGTPVISTLVRQKLEEDQEFKDILSYISNLRLA